MFVGLKVDLSMTNSSKEELYEIRDYTIEPECFDRYLYWAENHFIPYAKEKIDIVDFWVDKGIDAEVNGTNPIVSTNGQPNITWVANIFN